MSHQAKAEEIFQTVLARYYRPEIRLFHESYPVRLAGQQYASAWSHASILSAVNALSQEEMGQGHLSALGEVLEGLEHYWLPPGYLSFPMDHGGGDRYYDDNEWIALELLVAYRLLRDQRLLDRAVQVFEFVVSGWSDDMGGGIYWREGDRSTKNTCSNGPAVVLGLELYGATGEERYLDWALRIYNWVNRHLRSEEGVYWDHVTSAGEIDRRVYTYNTGIMIQANALLYGLTGLDQCLEEAERLAQASLEYFAGQQVGDVRVFPPTPWFNAVLYRGYLALQAAGGAGEPAAALTAALDHAWDHVRDANGLLMADWSGQGRAQSLYRPLLDQAAAIEVYALSAGQSAAAQTAGAQTDGGGEMLPAAARADMRSGQAGAVRGLVSPLGTRGNCRSLRAGGTCWSDTQGSQLVPAEFFAYYDAQGGPGGPLGFPVTPAAIARPSRMGTTGFFQRFEGSQYYPADVIGRLGNIPFGATVYWSDRFGAFATWFEVGARYEQAGGTSGELGFPISERAASGISSLGTRGYRQDFENGCIYWSQAFGAHPVWGAIYNFHQRLGGPVGMLGFPVAPELPALPSPQGTRGVFQRFEGRRPYSEDMCRRMGSIWCGSTIYWSAATGAHATWGEVGERYEREGGTGGRLGFPVSDLMPDGLDGPHRVYSQHFENGSIVWRRGRQAEVV